jgi:hypothetical protein
METTNCVKCEEAIRFDTPCYINCKECGKIINFTQRTIYYGSLKRSKTPGLCSSCLKKGERNPFFNKKHTKESMKKMIETSNNSEKRKKYYEKIKSEEYRNFLSDWMKENTTMRGRSYYTIWVEKYGKEIADKMNDECSLKKAVKGEKNYWFGKTPPYGSGNGWSGWYKGWYFRSLLELSYMINVIEKHNVIWEPGEISKYKVTFDYNGLTKNYHPDFILNGKYMIECKPKNLWKTNLVQAKADAAKDFCEKNGLTYKLRTTPILSDDEITSLYLNGDLIWIDRYKIKYENRINNKTKI